VIVEQRDYHAYTGKLRQLVGLYADEGIELQKSHLGTLLGAYTTDVGALSTLTSLWAFEGWDDRAERRARLQEDERWQAFLAKIQPLIHTQQSRIMIPTPYSPVS